MKRHFFIFIISVCIVFLISLLSISIFFQPKDKPIKNKANIPDKELLEIRLKGTYQEVNAGITPQNPFYLFDVIGEKIKLFFIKDAKKRALFVLLLSQEKNSEIALLSEKNAKKQYIEASQRQHTLYLENLSKQLSLFRTPYPTFLNDLATRVSESMSHQLSIIKNNQNVKENITILFLQSQDIISATFAETDTLEQISRENKNQPTELLE